MFFKNTNDKIIKKLILVISLDEIRAKNIKEHLSIKGLDVKTLIKNYKDINAKDLGSNLIAIIIDLGIIKNVNESINILNTILPKDNTCIVFADNDSITIRQEFLNKGLRYLHYETQFNELFYELDSQSENKGSFSSIQISVLGTKGGIGTSFIAYLLAKNIYDRFCNKTLLLQGANSSFNIDLFSDISFNTEYFQDKGICLYKESLEDNFVGFNKYSEHKINFMVYDQGIYNASKENIELTLSNSDCVVLVINKELASIKKTKEVLETNDFLLSVNQGAKRIILVLNELSPIKTLSIGDIEELLKRKIDLIIPFKSGIKEVKNNGASKINKAISSLVNLVIGIKEKPLSLFKRKI
ncbi:hypothetical protein AVBRAN9334_01310 [Campylobacter sp. RM9334]|uniref:hypothetical protein n=1 Tax=Campylobacter sp. RM9334 TaxID=2735732 RepID=UPI001DABC84C|nr:hypothetical protein [Campylobacter sp. RM9334]